MFIFEDVYGLVGSSSCLAIQCVASLMILCFLLFEFKGLSLILKKKIVWAFFNRIDQYLSKFS